MQWLDNVLLHRYITFNFIEPNQHRVTFCHQECKYESKFGSSKFSPVCMIEQSIKNLYTVHKDKTTFISWLPKDLIKYIIVNKIKKSAKQIPTTITKYGRIKITTTKKTILTKIGKKIWCHKGCKQVWNFNGESHIVCHNNTPPIFLKFPPTKLVPTLPSIFILYVCIEILSWNIWKMECGPPITHFKYQIQ